MAWNTQLFGLGLGDAAQRCSVTHMSPISATLNPLAYLCEACWHSLHCWSSECQNRTPLLKTGAMQPGIPRQSCISRQQIERCIEHVSCTSVTGRAAPG